MMRTNLNVTLPKQPVERFLTSRSLLPPLREYPEFRSLCCEPQFRSDPEPVSGDKLLTRVERLASAHTALTDGRTWQKSESKTKTRDEKVWINVNEIVSSIFTYLANEPLLSFS